MIGHRGSRLPGGAVENTSAAFRAAFDAGAAAVETDVRRLGDGTLVLHHDPHLPDGRALVGLGPAEAAAAGVTTLAELLADRSGGLVLEIKNGPGEPDFDAPYCATADALCAALAGTDTTGITVSSFDWFTLERVRELGGPPTALLTQPRVALRAGAAWCAEHGAGQLHASSWQVLAEGDEGVEECRSRGVALVAWTVTTVEQALLLRGLGVDGVICDDPAAVLAAYGV